MTTASVKKFSPRKSHYSKHLEIDWGKEESETNMHAHSTFYKKHVVRLKLFLLLIRFSYVYKFLIENVNFYYIMVKTYLLVRSMRMRGACEVDCRYPLMVWDSVCKVC